MKPLFKPALNIFLLYHTDIPSSSATTLNQQEEPVPFIQHMSTVRSTPLFKAITKVPGNQLKHSTTKMKRQYLLSVYTVLKKQKIIS